MQSEARSFLNPELNIPRKNVKPVRISEIPSWPEYFKNHQIELVGVQPSRAEIIKEEVEEFDVDLEISSKVSFYEGDITALGTEGIVCPHGEAFQTIGGVSDAIVRRGGFRLRVEVLQLRGFAVGSTITTPGYDLPVKYVVHTVVPRELQPHLLANCYKDCLEQMRIKQMKSLAFCCIATGLFDYSDEKAVIIALRAVRNWLQQRKYKQQLENIDRVVFCVFESKDVSLYKAWMQVFFPCTAQLQKAREKGLLRPLPGLIKITTTEPDMLGLDDSPRKAKMPCGHVIGPDSMTDYCKNLLVEGKYKFKCPSVSPPCNREWDYFLVRHVANLTPEEMQQFEKKISDNYLKKSQGRQTCPGCGTWCFRAPGTGKAVRCPICTSKQGRNFDFCWSCLGQWIGSDSNGPCPVATQDVAERINVLKSCVTVRPRT